MNRFGDTQFMKTNHTRKWIMPEHFTPHTHTQKHIIRYIPSYITYYTHSLLTYNTQTHRNIFITQKMYIHVI